MSLILSIAAASIFSGQDAIEPRLLRFPDVYGSQVVFGYAGDLWITSTEPNAMARRLTSHVNLETRPKFSPDGKWVAFTGSYDGNPDVYVISVEGGEPKRLTFDPGTDNVIDWTKDGRVAYASNAQSYPTPKLQFVDPDGGIPSQTPIQEISDGSFFEDGNTIAYTRAPSQGFNWRRYRGGTQGKISIYNMSTNTYSELPHKREQSYWPMVAKNSIYYVSDKTGGVLNLYRYDLGSKKDTQLTSYNDSDIKWPGSDGKSIVFERDGYIYLTDLKGSEPRKLSPRILGENLAARPTLRPLSDQISNIALSPSGARVAVEARGEIFSVPVKTGDTRNFTNSSGARERLPAWSPDGKSIAYVSDVNGDPQVFMEPQLGGEAVQLSTNAPHDIVAISWSPNNKMIAIQTRPSELWVLDVATKSMKKVGQPYTGGFGTMGYDWSPDSKWIAAIFSGENLLGALYMYDVDGAKLTKVSEGYYNDTNVSFDLSGKYLYLLSERTFNQQAFGISGVSMDVQDATRAYVITLAKDTPDPLNPTNDEETAGEQPATPTATPSRVDLEGMADRAVPLPFSAGTYGGIIGLKNAVLVASQTGVTKFDLATRESQAILASPITGSLSFNPDRTKVAYNMGGSIGVLDVRPGIAIGQGRVNTSAVEAVIDPRKEWKQIFWEAWRWTRDNFYDPNMLGLNWKQIGDHYAGYLQYVNHRSDLNTVLGMMIGELGTGHSYVTGGDMGAGARTVNTGQLGADYAVVSGHIQFKKIYKGHNFEEQNRSPLQDPGVDVKEGDFLLEIDSQPVTPNTHPSSLLVGKAGRQVTLTVNSSPSLSGARKVRVRPTGSEQSLRYVAWADENREKVAKLSGGRIGYMHVPNTQFEGATEFVKGYRSQADKDGLIVDERNNGGGFFPTFFIERLMRSNVLAVQQRNGEDFMDDIAISGPKAMLINYYAGSGGDMFPYLFRARNLGPIIGTRTWGGLVGIGGYAPLVDGGGITAPEFAIYDPKTNTIVAENTGIDPDIDIDNRPDLVAQGRDPQLEKAVEVVMEQIKKLPPRVKRTKLPIVGKNGHVGG